MNKNVIFTISSLNYLHYSLNVRASFLKYNKKYDFIIFLMDNISDEYGCKTLLKLNESGIDIRSFLELKNNIEFYPIEEMLLKYTVLEVNTSIKPYCIDYLFNNNYEKVIYIDPDIQFFSSIDKLDSLLDKWDIILTPHMMHPYPEDGKQQECQTIMMAGMNNCGFFAVKNSVEGKKAVSFWEQKLKDKCYVDIPNALFTDQKWSDWFPYICNNVYILKDYGYNAAYWNLHERIITNKNGEWYANNDKLVFYHFSGLNRKDINIISKYQNRFTLSNRKKDLEELFLTYLNSVDSFNADIFSSIPYYYSKVINTDCLIPDQKRRKTYHKQKLFITNKNDAIQAISGYDLDAKNYNFNVTLGINIIGYVEETHSIGEVARNFIDRLLGTSIPFTIFCVHSGSKKIEDEKLKKYMPFITQTPCFPINIIFVNADQLPIVMNDNKHIFDNKYNIANFWWEFESGFEKFSDAHKLVDKIIVCSDHVKKGIQNAIHDINKIQKITYPLDLNIPKLEEKDIIRKKYSINTNHYVFFFNFDYASSFDRKNPTSILEAFHNSFSDNDNVSLVIKTSNSDKFVQNKKYFNNKIKQLNLYNKVIIIEDYLEKKEILSIINACDVYISLHRAEGLGLGMCEAMLLGKPVIASCYSGNLEFMNNDNSLLVNTKKIHANIDFYHYDQVKEWGDPDISQASEKMKFLYNNRNYGNNIGENAKKSILEHFSYKNFKNDIYNIILKSNVNMTYEKLYGTAKKKKFKKIRLKDGQRIIYIFGIKIFSYKK